MLGSSSFTLVTVVLCLHSHSGATAMMIDGKQMSMDEAIMKASNSTKMFELMQNDNEVMVEMDMRYDLNVYSEMRREMERMKDDKRRKKRKAVRGENYRWPNNTVPYEISFEFSAADRQLIMAAIADYHKYTCLKFRAATSSDANKIRYVNGGGCSSYVGMVGGTQTVTLATGCRVKGIIIHETGHAIGFHHEQTRPNRDSYVLVQEGNISPGVAYNFMRYTPEQQDDYRVPYDYLSVMHYSQYAFSFNGQPTIVARDDKYQSLMGNREGLSFFDIQLANAMYDCAASKGCSTNQCPTGGFQGPDCKCWCDSGDRMSPVIECGRQIATTRATAAPGRTVPTTAPTGLCEDSSRYCREWKEAGYCTGTYARYMQANCKLTCNFCDMTPTPTTTAMPTPPVSNCMDSSKYCATWAKNGECDRNPSYMLRYCSRSCERCKGEPIECRDRSDYCSKWAASGYCTDQVYKPYLEMNCRRSCNICAARDEDVNPSTQPTTASSCQDRRERLYCDAQRRHCNSNPRVMNVCQKTCGQCS